MRYAKSCNQLYMIHQVTGMANANAISTSNKNCFDKMYNTCPTEAPITLRMPISLVRCKILYADKPISPKHAINMASDANMPKTFPYNASARYCWLYDSSRK